MVRIILNKVDDLSWESYGFKKLSEIEDAIINDEDIDISFKFYEFLKSNNIKFQKIKYVNDYGMTNYWIDKFKNKGNEIISYSFSLDNLTKDDFYFQGKKKKFKNKKFAITSTATLYDIQKQLLDWDFEETIVFNNLQEYLKVFLEKWCLIFGVKLEENKKMSLESQSIKGTEKFANLKFKEKSLRWKEFEIYSDPSHSNNKKKISQKTIIDSIVQNSILASENKDYKDHFVTAPTGSGKSLIFQSVAYFLAEKYNLLTIIISPLKSLMEDQVNSWKKVYKKVGSINSDLNVLERNKIINDIKKRKVHIVYIAPESLISYSYDFLFGQRRLGLLIVDEAHIVTTWGKGFRPDYWYLDRWILQRRKEYKFQIATFTATASYSEIKNYAMNKETIRNLCMTNPIQIISPAYRNDIKFEIQVSSDLEKITKEIYLNTKQQFLMNQIEKNEKMIIYFPYKKFIRETSAFLKEKNIEHSMYHGDLDKNEKKKNFEDFKKNKTKIMLATKAFGMGIDIEDIKRVAHFAPTGLINDYLQEVGRAARRPSLVGVGSILSIFHDGKMGSNDFSHINKLHGMSSIKNENIKQMVRIIKNMYERNKKANYENKKNSLLVPMDNFISSNFDEVKVKTTFLMIQRDIEKNFKYVGLVIRPGMLMTEIFVERIDKKIGKKSIFETKIDNYFKKSVKNDIYQFDLKKMWEENFKNISFPLFKYLFLSPIIFGQKVEEVSEKTIWKIGQLKNIVSPRQIIVFDKDDHFEQIKNSYIFSENILKEIVSKKTNETNEKLIENAAKKFNINKFQILEFLSSLYNYYDWLNKTKGEGIGFLNPIRIKDEYTYNFKKRNGYVRPLYLDLLNIKNRNLDINNSYILPLSLDKKNSYTKWIYQLKVLEIWNKFSVELKSGIKPMVYISVNAPTVIDSILKSDYENYYVAEASLRFKKGKEVMKEFLTKKMTENERKKFIEDLFLFRNEKI